MNALWWLLPDQFLPLLILGIGLALILGVMRGRRAVGLLGMVVLVLMAGPLFEALVSVLPGWAFFLLMLLVAVTLVRKVLSLLLGERAAAHVIGELVADLIRLCFVLLFLPFRIVWWVVRRV